MTDKTYQTDDIRTDLRSQCLALLPRLARERALSAERAQELDDAIRDAEAWRHRRAAKLERDGRCYRLGAAWEPADALDLDDLILSGLDPLGAHGLMLLAAVAMTAPEHATVSELLRRLSRTPAGRIVRAWGVCVRWYWLRNLYEDEVAAFQRSPKGRDPKAAWRRGRPTVRQEYLAGEIARLLQIVPPTWASRGEAHDWLLRQGGNPRFREAPPLPPVPTVADLTP